MSKQPRLAAFALEEFETALEAFRKAQEMKAAGDTDPRKYRTWIRKCEAEMEAEEDDLQAAVAAAEQEKSLSNAPGTAVAPVAGTPAVVKRTPVVSAPAHLRIKFQYYQSYEKVTVAVLEKGLKEGEVEVEVEKRRLTVRQKGNGGALLFDKTLYEEVIPDKRKTRFMASKVRGRYDVREEFLMAHSSRQHHQSFVL